MNKEIIKKIKVFAASALLAGSITLLPGCHSTNTNTPETDSIEEKIENKQEYEEIIEEISAETGFSINQIKKIIGQDEFDIYKNWSEKYNKSLDEVKYLIKNKLYEYIEIQGPYSIEFNELDNSEKTFEPGEHMIIITFGNIQTNTQLPYIEGYKAISISESSYRIPSGTVKSNMSILYINEVQVLAKATRKDEKTGEYIYQRFGTPTNLEKQEAKVLTKKK